VSVERTGRVAGVVLAAGESTRMGRNKMLVEIDGESLVRGAARRAREAGLDPVLVVVGHERERTEAELEGLDVGTVVSDAVEEGKNRSMRLGIGSVPDDAPAAVVMLADMPLVTAEMIATLVARYREGTAPLVASRYGDVNAPPILYDRSLFDELRTTREQGCGKAVVRRHRDEADVVDWPPEALTDVDRPEDLERVRAVLAGG